MIKGWWSKDFVICIHRPAKHFMANSLIPGKIIHYSWLKLVLYIRNILANTKGIASNKTLQHSLKWLCHWNLLSVSTHNMKLLLSPLNKVIYKETRLIVNDIKNKEWITEIPRISLTDELLLDILRGDRRTWQLQFSSSNNNRQANHDTTKGKSSSVSQFYRLNAKLHIWSKGKRKLIHLLQLF